MIYYFVKQDHTLLYIEKNYTVSDVSKKQQNGMETWKQNVIASSSNYNDILDL